MRKEVYGGRLSSINRGGKGRTSGILGLMLQLTASDHLLAASGRVDRDHRSLYPQASELHADAAGEASRRQQIPLGSSNSPSTHLHGVSCSQGPGTGATRRVYIWIYPIYVIIIYKNYNIARFTCNQGFVVAWSSILQVEMYARDTRE